MGTVHIAISAGLFIIETIMQLCVVGTHSQSSETLFVILLSIVMAPLILINFVSAIQVTRTQDFSGKTCGRVLCIAFHSFQLGIIWRSLKLLILFDKKDWQDYIKMRLFHGGFQSIPFSLVLSFSMFNMRTSSGLDIFTIVSSLVSASVSLTIFRVSNVLDASEDTDSDDEDKASKRCNEIRKHIGVIFLVFSTTSVIFSRCASIVLFTVVQPYWVALPLFLHFVFHLIKASIRLKCNDDKILTKILKAIYTSFVNIFDMVGRDYTGVKCSYVFYYTIMLIENLVFSFYWMLTSDMEERSKLYAVLVVLLCFIVGMIVKFTSCGCIFNIESDILSDAFNNPELQGEKKKKPDKEMNKNIETVADDVTFHEICNDETQQHSNIPVLQGVASSPSRKQKRRSKRGSSTTSSNSRLREYDNQAFVRSQGNISFNSQQTGGSKKQTQDEGDNVSFEYRTISRSSQEKSHSSRDRSQRKSEKCSDDRNNPRSPHARSHSKGGHSKSKHKASTQRAEVHDKENRVPQIIVSDTSKRAQQKQVMSGNNTNTIKVRNADIASSHSKYSRNTNTLNGSVQNYKYNGFDDPFRERRQFEISARKNHKYDRHLHEYHYHHHHRQRNYRNRPSMDYSLDSSELYPSMTSDTSSMTSYTDTNEQLWRKHRQRIKRRNRHFELRDGYSTDVSNSDNLSYNDYSMEDSSSWTGSSSSSSDGAATWPPRHTANLLKAYNIPDKESSAENIIHWLETMETEASDYDSSFSVTNEQPIPSDTDISLSAMQTFEVKKEKKKFKRMISKPKGLLLKFSSLNYKRRDSNSQNRPYPLKQNNPPEVVPVTTEINSRNNMSMNDRHKDETSDSAMPLPVDSVQESIV